MKKITFSHGSDFEVSAKKQEHLNKMIDGVIKLLSEQCSYTFSYSIRNEEDKGTEYVCFNKYQNNLFDTKIANLIALHDDSLEVKPPVPEIFSVMNERKRLIVLRLKEIVDFCMSEKIPFFYYIIVGNGYYSYFRKDDDGRRYSYEKADVEYISKIVSPRDLGLYLENDLITKSLRYVVTDYLSVEGLLQGTCAQIDIFCSGME